MTASTPLPSRASRTSLLQPVGRPPESFPAPPGGNGAAAVPAPSAPLPAADAEGDA